MVDLFQVNCEEIALEQGKTIKEIAEELGVSKTAVRKQIANLGLQTSFRLVSMLQHELEIKNRELEIKNKQIEELNARLAEVTSALTTAQQTAQAAQALHAGMIQQQLKSGEAASAEPETPDKGKRKRWWKW